MVDDVAIQNDSHKELNNNAEADKRLGNIVNYVGVRQCSLIIF